MWELAGTIIVQIVGAAFTYGILWQKVKTLDTDMKQAKDDIRDLNKRVPPEHMYGAMGAGGVP